jgi:hypothetical protein
MKHKFKINRHWDLNYKDCIFISISPMLDLNYENHKSLHNFSISIGWLWFSINFEYTYYKNN